MKKLLGLLAVAPMALAACGGSDSKELTNYYLSHGENARTAWKTGDDFVGQNDSYQIAEIKVAEVDGKLEYTINESVGAYMTSADEVNEDVKAVPSFEADVAGAYTGAELLTAGFDTDSGTAAIDSALLYNNIGQSLRFIYGVQKLDIKRDDFDLIAGNGDYTTSVDFINKDDTTYPGLPQFDDSVKLWEAFLEKTFGTCDTASQITDEVINGYTSIKQSNGADSLVTGSTLTETGLYLGQAMYTARELCKA